VRVKIAYSVELDEVDTELNEISSGIVLKIREAAEKTEKAFDLLLEHKNNYGRSTTIVDEARHSLASADATLAEMQAILSALQTHYEGDRNVRDGRSGMDTTRHLPNAKTE
jgi:hypothetical protein